jgi:hypothetical protein
MGSNKLSQKAFFSGDNIREFIANSQGAHALKVSFNALTRRKNDLTDLNNFKKVIKESHTCLRFHPYTVNKIKIQIYKMIFFALTALFLFLSAYLVKSSLSWTCHLIFGCSVTIQYILCMTCVLFATSSFILGIMLQPETEIASQMIKKAKKRARKICYAKIFELKLQMSSAPDNIQGDGDYYRMLYEKTADAIDECKEKTALLLKRIRISKTLTDENKDTLYNQVLVDLQEKLDTIPCSIRRIGFPHHTSERAEPSVRFATPLKTPLHIEKSDDSPVLDSR